MQYLSSKSIRVCATFVPEYYDLLRYTKLVPLCSFLLVGSPRLLCGSTGWEGRVPSCEGASSPHRADWSTLQLLCFTLPPRWSLWHPSRLHSGEMWTTRTGWQRGASISIPGLLWCSSSFVLQMSEGLHSERLRSAHLFRHRKVHTKSSHVYKYVQWISWLFKTYLD